MTTNHIVEQFLHFKLLRKHLQRYMYYRSCSCYSELLGNNSNVCVYSPFFPLPHAIVQRFFNGSVFIRNTMYLIQLVMVVVVAKKYT